MEFTQPEACEQLWEPVYGTNLTKSLGSSKCLKISGCSMHYQVWYETILHSANRIYVYICFFVYLRINRDYFHKQHRLLFVTEMNYVYSDVRTENLNIIEKLSSGDKSSASWRGIMGSMPGLFLWDLWLTREALELVFLPVLQFSPVSIISPLLHTLSFIYRPRCIMFFSQCFSFPLSVSFHHCSILFYPSTTRAV